MPIIFLLLFCLANGIVHGPVTPEWFLNFTYHDHSELTTFLHEVVYRFPELATLYTIGKSVRDKDLWVLRLTSPKSQILGTPNVKFIGNIHGNEAVGRELILHFADHLVRNYQTDEEVRWLLDRAIIHLLPSVNPDGFESSKEGDCISTTGRANANSVDLNRSFPDYFRQNEVPLQPETKSIIRWLSAIPFAVSGIFHGGVLVVSYPFENDDDFGLHANLPKYVSAPDDDTLKYLAEVYAQNHRRMHEGGGCRMEGPEFPGGITNGAQWYKITGGMQDYSYINHGSMELTLEVSCCKYPPSNELQELWEDNFRAMMELAKRSQLGVRGLIMDATNGNGIPSANLSIIGREINFTSAETGEFWRILLPGDHILRVVASGYQENEFPFTVRETNESFPEPTWLNVYLKPEIPKISGSATLRFRFSTWIFLTIFLCRL